MQVMSVPLIDVECSVFYGLPFSSPVAMSSSSVANTVLWPSLTTRVSCDSCLCTTLVQSTSHRSEANTKKGSPSSQRGTEVGVSNSPFENVTAACARDCAHAPDLSAWFCCDRENLVGKTYCACLTYLNHSA